MTRWTLASSETAPRVHFGPSFEPLARGPDDPRAGLPTARAIVAMRQAYRATGGLASGDDVARMLEDRHCGDFVRLARLIVSGELFGFDWGGTFWVPMFQFNLRDLSIKDSAQRVQAQLPAACDGWMRAVWFARPHADLYDRPPVDLLEIDLPAVLAAARAERFIALA